MPRRKKTATIFEDRKTLFNYFRLGESYTSLILGIIVVIIGTVLLLSLAKTRSDNPQTSSANISRTVTQVIDEEGEIVISSTTEAPEKYSSNKDNKENTMAKRQDKEEKDNRIMNAKEGGAQVEKIDQGSTYEVREGDDLWDIAKRAYKSGYNWVDIARANNLSNPNQVEVGQKLEIPKVDQKNISLKTEIMVDGEQKSEVESGDKIMGSEYKIVKGDSLWGIAVRAYGDGYKWTDIAEANELVNPNLIHSGNKLEIPRE